MNQVVQEQPQERNGGKSDPEPEHPGGDRKERKSTVMIAASFIGASSPWYVHVIV
jgi:hypothetical protein